MDRLTEEKIVLIVRQTRLDDLVKRFNTMEQAKFYVEHLGSDFSDYLNEHDTYKRSMAVAETLLQRLGRVQVLHREFLPNFLFGKGDIVVVLGQDGLVANTMKYLSGQPVVGVNPDPGRWDGVLLPFTVDDLLLIMTDVLTGRARKSEITMAKATLADGQTLYGVNDLFIGAKTHVSARYSIHVDDRTENQSSSGIIVSTGLGSTGWLKSVLAGAAGIASAASGRPVPIPRDTSCRWDAKHLYFSVREPFPSQVTGASLVFGKIKSGSPMSIESKMAENGVIFSDGIEADYLTFNSGMMAEIGVSERCGYLVS